MNPDVEAIVKQSQAKLNGDPLAKPCLADLLDKIDHTIRQYVKLPVMKLSILIALWIALTYCFKQFRYCGYLALRSATPRCGKTTLLRLLSYLTYGTPNIESIPTAAVLFRDGQSVLLLDEVDKLRNADKEKYGEVMAVLNVGFEDGGAVRRCEGKAHTVTKYDVFSPKAVAGIEGIADTLADRSFQVGMERSETRMPRMNRRKMDERFEQLRKELQGWAEDNQAAMVEAYENLPDELDCLKSFDDRFQDISEPLIVLATLADVERPEGPSVLPRLLDALNAAAGRREPSGREKQLLEFLLIAVEKLGSNDTKFIPSAELVEACAKIEDLSYIGTPKKLAGLLKHFDLIPKSNGSGRGYDLTREWVETWQRRYPKPKE